jgi:Domain of unknown function (DUF4167)
MQNGPMTIMNARHPKPATTFSGRSKRWTSNATRPAASKGPQSAQRNYDRYLELARVEILNGDTVAAENYYQHAEHYFRSMSGDAT